MAPIKIALVGIGKIARDQHIPALAASQDYELVAAVTRHTGPEGIPSFRTIEEMLAAKIEVDAVSLCTPPVGRYALARTAIAAGLHVMLEKPPAASVTEVEDLADAARRRGVSLYTTWHTRAAPAIEPARNWVADRNLRDVVITWREDVKKWHPGQAWIWEPGGLGVFDPGINALSAITRIMPNHLHLTDAELFFPSNRAAPIAAHLTMSDANGTPVRAEFDWREQGSERWDIDIVTDCGRLALSKGGARLAIGGDVQVDGGAIDAEYPGLYARSAELVRNGESEVDLAPFRLVADAFMLGRRTIVEPFVE
ncbi:Gfo/Idh/MocA family protein [Pedomonas mirosovicensis]|uniref:Gfo/Idh/MocA family protein n=1 Tax=Pedomonas mirosovicensis TaxID=2908641 RepID=UPI00216A5028|nr:Gfo/Idh/MocA family oxidoreductase [Pedomonas mirosovicensis]MCH8686160.1 Gfo/Idh/MocA family oxidoreductase [Pedomonas mirosovicensis]